MHEHHGRPVLQLLEQRGKPGVPEADAAGVGQFGERAVDVRHGQAGEACEPVRAVAGQLGGQFVAPPGQYAGCGVVTSVHAGGADRGDGDVDAGDGRVRHDGLGQGIVVGHRVARG
jgi:hypothetical protein